jgi:hypothetical protein
MIPSTEDRLNARSLLAWCNTGKRELNTLTCLTHARSDGPGLYEAWISEQYNDEIIELLLNFNCFGASLGCT